VPTNITAQVRPQGRVEVVIDMDGRVTLVTIRQPMHPFYDQLVLSAAREWRYRPATFNGVPVKYRKTIGITVAR
jgi:TonB family protein